MRWVVSSVIGDGLTVQTAHRAKVAEHGDHSALIPGATDGRPVRPWCLVAFRGDEGALPADPDIVTLPEAGAPITQAETVALARLGCPPGLVVAGMHSDAAALALGRALDGKFELWWIG